VNIRNGQATKGVEGRSGNRADIPGATTPQTPWDGKTRRGSSVAEHRWWQGHNLVLLVAAATARRVGTPLPPSCGPGPSIGARGTRPEIGGGQHHASKTVHCRWQLRDSLDRTSQAKLITVGEGRRTRCPVMSPGKGRAKSPPTTGTASCQCTNKQKHGRPTPHLVLSARPLRRVVSSPSGECEHTSAMFIPPRLPQLGEVRAGGAHLGVKLGILHELGQGSAVLAGLLCGLASSVASSVASTGHLRHDCCAWCPEAGGGLVGGHGQHNTRRIGGPKEAARTDPGQWRARALRSSRRGWHLGTLSPRYCVSIAGWEGR
jgi:hypothetical protein